MFTNADSDDWARMTDWVVEAYRDDSEELAWDLLLRGLGKEDLERELSMVLATPDAYPTRSERTWVPGHVTRTPLPGWCSHGPGTGRGCRVRPDLT